MISCPYAVLLFVLRQLFIPFPIPASSYMLWVVQRFTLLSDDDKAMHPYVSGLWDMFLLHGVFFFSF